MNQKNASVITKLPACIFLDGIVLLKEGFCRNSFVQHNDVLNCFLSPQGQEKHLLQFY